jgi:SAM-dependent methyltransferase
VIEFIVGPLVIVGLAANGLRLRARVPPALPVSALPSPSSSGPTVGTYVWAGSRAVSADEATRRDAPSYAHSEGLEMLDLVPTDLPVTAARDLVRRVDPRACRRRLAPGGSAGALTLIDPALLERAGAAPAGDAEPSDVIGLARRIRPYAGDGAGIAVAPWLRAGSDSLTMRKARLRAAGVMVPVHIALDVVPYALTAITLVAGWQWGLGALAAYCLQPYLIFAGTALRPRGLHAAALLRPVHDPYVWARTAAGRWRSAADDHRDAGMAEAAAYYRAALADGTTRFLEERREQCPWCGSGQLSVRLRTPDAALHKPGMFALEQCADCGHIFQNPRLSPEGLDFYYRDAYDGAGADLAEGIFMTGVESYRARARMLQPFTKPSAWLDVGTGHAHFCAVAREIWPGTVFDGLDQGSGIEEARRKGWISTAYRGMFPELADSLAGLYDVISMHHYLEHTREPLAELDAAAAALPPDGYLLIEVPDPQWRLASLFGRYWMPWFQPQHQHTMPVANLTAALQARGLIVMATERGRAHQANDAVLAAYLFFDGLASDRTLPWSRRPPTTAARIWRFVVWTAGAPVVAAGLLLDMTLGRALALWWDRGNAYRVLARKQDGGYRDGD